MVELNTVYMKRGMCTAFNAGSFENLAHESVPKSAIWRFSVDTMNLEMDQGNVYLSHQAMWPPYNTSHKDLGLEMEIFEGIFLDWRPVVYENFGYDVGIKSPVEAFDESVFTFTVSLNHSYLFLIKPHLTIADESLITMSPSE